MNRRTFIRSVAAPVALAMLIGVAWARSHRVLDEWSMATHRGQVRAVCVYQGGVHLIRGGQRAATRPISHAAYDVPPGATWGNLYPFGSIAWRFAGLHKLHAGAGAAAVLTGAATAAPPFPALPGYQPTPWLPGFPFEAWVVPIWWAVVLALSPTAVPVWRRWQSWRRARRGRCARCGYDLRATPGRCPECGWRLRQGRHAGIV